jgi:hypothetical protein
MAMNTGALYLLTLCLLAPSFLLRADPASAQGYADKYYKEWSAQRGDDDDGDMYRVADFCREAPAAFRLDILDLVIERAHSPGKISGDSRADNTALDVLTTIINSLPNTVLPPRLDAVLAALSKDPDSGIRAHVLQVLGDLNRPADHDLFVAALSDPRDDVRGAAIHALLGRADAGAIFRKYIGDHQADPAYKASVSDAEAGLRGVQETGTGQ